MTRKLILLLAILFVSAVPAHARGGHGSHGHHHHHRFHSFGGFYSSVPDNYPCWWEREHWVDQLYGDRYGNTTTVREWVPGRWMCW